MSFEEKSAWIMGVVALASYGVYLAIVLGLAGTMTVAEVPYVVPLLWTVGASIATSILLHALIGIFSPREAGKKDQRDREIYRFGGVHRAVVCGHRGHRGTAYGDGRGAPLLDRKRHLPGVCVVRDAGLRGQDRCLP